MIGTRDDRSRLAGIVLVLASNVFFALAGIFTKSTAADAWTVASWRGLFGALAIGLYVYLRRDPAKGRANFALGWRGWALAVVGGVASIFFIAAFKHTYVANVAVIYATIPFVAAAIEWLVFGNRPGLALTVTAAVSLGGVLIIVAGNVGGGHLFGDALALVMTLLCAIYLVMVRAFRDTPVVWAAAVSALLLFAAGWLTTDLLAISSRDFAVVACFGLSFATASTLWNEGARRLPASEAGLLGGAEVPLAILFAWLILSELPPREGMLGGAIVLAAVFTYAGRDFVMKKRRRTVEVGAS